MIAWFQLTFDQEKYEQVDPEDIYKMPVGTDHFHWYCIVVPEFTAECLEEHYQEGDSATQYVHGMQSENHI
jgi:hypothetical protein